MFGIVINDNRVFIILSTGLNSGDFCAFKTCRNLDSELRQLLWRTFEEKREIKKRFVDLAPKTLEIESVFNVGVVDDDDDGDNHTSIASAFNRVSLFLHFQLVNHFSSWHRKRFFPRPLIGAINVYTESERGRKRTGDEKLQLCIADIGPLY